MGYLYSIVSGSMYIGSVFAPTLISAMLAPKRERYVLRLLLCVAVSLIIQMAFIVPREYMLSVPDAQPYIIWVASFQFFLAYVCSLVTVKLCNECDFYGALFCATSGYCVQHIQARVESVLNDFAYPGINDWAAMGISLCIIVVFSLLYYLFVKKVRQSLRLSQMQNRGLLFVAALMVFVNIFYNSFGIKYANTVNVMFSLLGVDSSLGTQILVFAYVMSALFAIVAFLLSYMTLVTVSLNKEATMLRQMLEEKERQYDKERENIELINVKCHDIRHFLRNNEIISDGDRREMIDSIRIYDSTFKTGNDALDVLFTQKTLYCNTHGIRLTCLIDGSKLSFMKPSEVYALFGNALDNAVEYVEGLAEEKRIVSVTELGGDNPLKYRIENYFDGELRVDADGLPITDNDKNYHGFGIKSMKLIARRYGGDVGVAVDGNSFSVNIALFRTAENN